MASDSTARDGETAEEREQRDLSAGELALAQPLIYDQMDANRLAVIKDQLIQAAERSQNLIVPTDQDIAVGLELAARYELDFFANEIWITKTRRGQLMIMVGRDGLRKVARRNGLRIFSDVVRENDTFGYRWDFEKMRVAINHEVAGAKHERGELIGAWCLVLAADGTQQGFFFAPLDEYKPEPGPKLTYSPWGTQESVMALTAAERNALRQATPLSGLLGEGEMDLNEQVAAGEAGGALSAAGIEAINAVLDKVACPEDVRDELREAIMALNALEPNAYGAARAQMTLLHQDEEGIMRELRYIREERERIQAEQAEAARIAEEEVTEAEVVGS
ncbi:MAG TPA: RecT family recombinase [Longimicrobiales bacterium]